MLDDAGINCRIVVVSACYSGGYIEPLMDDKTIVITAFAATGHATFTATLGLLVALLGVALSDRIGIWFPRLAGGVLILFGLFYVVRQLSGHTHTHLHSFVRPGHSHEHEHKHAHEHEHAPKRKRMLTKTDVAAVSSLLLLLTFSPC